MSITQIIAIATTDRDLTQKVSDGLAGENCIVETVADEGEIFIIPDLVKASLLLVDTKLGFDKIKVICDSFRNTTKQDIGIIAIVDGYSEDLERLVDAAVDDILVQPFTSFSLLARVKTQLKRVSTAKQLAFKIRDSWVLIDITSKLVGTRDLLDSLYEMVLILSDELNASRTSVVLVRPQRDLGLVVASSDNQNVKDLVISLESYPEIVKVCTSGKPLVIQDVKDSNVMKEMLPTLQSVKVKSIALFPIIEEGEVLGVIFLRYEKMTDSFSQRQTVFCQTVANATSIALRNYQFVESLREKDKEIEEVQSNAQSKLANLQPYEEFFKSSVDGMMVLSDTGVVVFINPEGATMLGRVEKEVVGLPINTLFSPGEIDSLYSLIDNYERGLRSSADLVISLGEEKESFEKIISTTAALLGSERMTLLTMRDVTEERETARRLIIAKEQLIKSEKQNAIMEVAGAAAHELNQPLTSILASMSMFKKIIGDDRPEIVTRLFDGMEQEVDRMTTIIKKLSRLTDYTTKEYVGHSKIVDLELSSSSDKNSIKEIDE